MDTLKTTQEIRLDQLATLLQGISDELEDLPDTELEVVGAQRLVAEAQEVLQEFLRAYQNRS